MTRHPFVASPGNGCSTCGQLRSAAIHDWETTPQQERIEQLAAMGPLTFLMLTAETLSDEEVDQVEAEIFELMRSTEKEQ